MRLHPHRRRLHQAHRRLHLQGPAPGRQGITAMSTKEEDYVDTVFTASTHDFILFFTNKGRVHRKKGYQIPEAGRTARGTNWSMCCPSSRMKRSPP